MKSLLWLCAIFFSFIFTNTAQEAVPFKTQKAFYIYGDAVTIGNNILSKDAIKPYNNIKLTNDDIDMVYVDVDQDDSTFSSSSATLQLPDNQKKIAYAVLYWSATYSYIKGSRREENSQFYFQGKRQRNRTLINKIKLKLPGENYQNIKGNVLFDGATQPSFALNAPYVCFADVTKQLQEAKTTNGEYTVANINATEGFVSGGSAAGWMLYIVYEAPTEKPKYITTFNGFVHVGNEPVEINLDNFKTPETGATTTDLTIAALEGDSDITEDECVIANPKLKKAWRLRTKDRDEKNFFSSQISSSKKANLKRNPSSNNTLGFDIASLTLPNNDEAVIVNNTDEVELFFNTKQDRFYLFFTAFQTEISETFFEEIENNLPTNAVVMASQKPKVEPIVLKEIRPEPLPKPKTTSVVTIETKPIEKTSKQEINTTTITLKQPEVIEVLPVKEDVNPISSEVIASPAQKQALAEGEVYISSSTYVKALKLEDKPLETQAFKLLLEKNAAQIDGVKKGYYVINKFFSEAKNAIAWQNQLKNLGFNSDILIDDNKELYYVYVFHTENFYDAYMQHKTLIVKEPFKENWVFKVNMTEY
ncbi:hypothetical protein [Olleya sp. YS]|uniref:hypothetical protein n=1 Tax=Olleya sp. YS TaxID=3028318 RepID=UPI00243460C9|nr:hypothetical protein [Olleya sp. YS]WGD35791.1 hypothetical protein Ollyesu_05100 [Olleya sp. YS]